MEERQKMWVHPFLQEPKAGEREIRMRPGRMLPIARGKEREHAE